MNSEKRNLSVKLRCRNLITERDLQNRRKLERPEKLWLVFCGLIWVVLGLCVLFAR